MGFREALRASQWGLGKSPGAVDFDNHFEPEITLLGQSREAKLCVNKCDKSDDFLYFSNPFRLGCRKSASIILCRLYRPI